MLFYLTAYRKSLFCHRIGLISKKSAKITKKFKIPQRKKGFPIWQDKSKGLRNGKTKMNKTLTFQAFSLTLGNFENSVIPYKSYFDLLICFFCRFHNQFYICSLQKNRNLFHKNGIIRQVIRRIEFYEPLISIMKLFYAFLMKFVVQLFLSLCNLL